MTAYKLNKSPSRLILHRAFKAITTMESLPVVDFSCLTSEEAPPRLNELDQLAHKLIEAFTTVGFVYITNHGVPQSQINDVDALAKEFFSLPLKIKNKYPLKDNHGYIMVEEEGGTPDGQGDLKESFNMTPTASEVTFPTEIDNFETRMMALHEACWNLSQRIMRTLAHGLGLTDTFFERYHTYMGQTNQTALRILYYPPLPKNAVKQNQMRLEEHTDFGCITLLFQDDVGGLEVLNQKGEWVHASPMEGAVLVNIADLLQRWSADRLKSTVHRIRYPTEEFRLKSSRYSIAYFFDPDSDLLIECFDNSNKYPPVVVDEFFENKLSQMKA